MSDPLHRLRRAAASTKLRNSVLVDDLHWLLRRDAEAWWPVLCVPVAALAGALAAGWRP